MMTILKNRANVSQALEEEMQGDENRLRKHVPIAIIKDILRAKQRGWDASRISKEYNLDRSVVEKLEKQIAIPVDNVDGVV
jgi:predicted transcriptional regulator